MSKAAALVRAAVRKGGRDLDADALRAVKHFARQSDEHVVAVFEELWQQLSAPHAQVRFLALQLAAQLWSRSAAFRHALLPHVMPDLDPLRHGELEPDPRAGDRSDGGRQPQSRLSQRGRTPARLGHEPERPEHQRDRRRQSIHKLRSLLP